MVVTRMEINASPNRCGRVFERGEFVGIRADVVGVEAVDNLVEPVHVGDGHAVRRVITVSVRIVDKSRPPNWENGPGKIGFWRETSTRERIPLVGSPFFPFGEWYKCRVEYRAELRPNRYKVP